MKHKRGQRRGGGEKGEKKREGEERKGEERGEEKKKKGEEKKGKGKKGRRKREGEEKDGIRHSLPFQSLNASKIAKSKKSQSFTWKSDSVGGKEKFIQFSVIK